jgi:uncharacterized protein (DUF362 family)
MDTNNKISRRDFLARAAKAGISVAAFSAAAKLLCESNVLKMIPVPEAIADFKNYSVPAIAGKTMSVVSGADRTQTVSKAIELLGGIDRFVKHGETVLLKPNIGFARPARIGATSHPDIISEITRLCYEYGKAKKVYVMDNPINDPASCFELSGISAAAAKSGAEIILPRGNLFRPVSLKDGKLIQNWPMLYEPLKKVDKIIGIAAVKNHARSGASMTMKNWYGLLGGGRNNFHRDINTIIVELAMLMKPTLVILDGTDVMMTNGPTGGSVSDLKKTNIMIAGCDQIAVDAFGATLLDMTAESLPYLTRAEELKLGTTDYKSLKPIFA